MSTSSTAERYQPPWANDVDPQATILIVDDVPENLRLLSMTLTQEGYDVRNAISGKVALMGVATELPDLVLLDVSMPDIDGFEVCLKLKSNPNTKEIPVIFISALGEVLDKVKAFEVGGSDYVTKPFQIAEVLARVRHQLTLRQLKQKLSDQNQQLQQTLQKQATAEAEVRHLNQVLEQRVQKRTQQLQATHETLRREMLEKQQAQSKLLHMAMYDPLTGLANRPVLLERLEQALQTIQSAPNQGGALVLVDCDRFKSISDTLGHLRGDHLLLEIANRITTAVPEQCLVARLGGDEFAILLVALGQEHSIHSIIKNLQLAFADPIQIAQYAVTINASIGVVHINATYRKAEYLLRDADLAMVQAKQQQRGSLQIFVPEMHHQALHRLSMEGRLRQAFKQNQLDVYYQPIVDLTAPGIEKAMETGGTLNLIAGFEALTRWQCSSTTKFISPSEFIPLAEEIGLILPMGDWIFQTACQQLSQWNQTRPAHNPLFMSINFSVHQLTCEGFTQRLDEVLQTTQVQPHWLKLEITESVLMQNAESVMAALTYCRQLGMQISIDDFGTGYSSLNYLRQLPVDILKVDRTFIQDLEAIPDNLKILEAILTLAQALDLEVVSEGIETQYQAQTLKQLGCTYGQGYRFARPLNGTDATALLNN